MAWPKDGRGAPVGRALVTAMAGVVLAAVAAGRLAESQGRETAPAPPAEDEVTLVVTVDGVARSLRAESVRVVGDQRGAAPATSLSSALEGPGDRGALVRFDLSGVSTVGRAELVLRTRVARDASADQRRIAVYRVAAPWRGAPLEWSFVPAVAKDPIHRGTMAAGECETRIPLTGVAASWREDPRRNFGVLLRAGAAPAGPDDPSERESVRVREGEPANVAARRLFRWASSVADAEVQARRAKRRVLVFVDAGHPGGPQSAAGDLVLWLLLADPGVRSLVESEFVPVCVTCPPEALSGLRPVVSDPLERVGSSVCELRTPALVVWDPTGCSTRSRAAIGAFDREDTLRLLAPDGARGGDGPYPSCSETARRAMRRGDYAVAAAALVDAASDSGGDPPPIQEMLGVCRLRLGDMRSARRSLEAAWTASSGTSAVAAYYLGCIDWREGSQAEARRRWTGLAERDPESPWAVAARLRLAAPERIAMYESLESAATPCDGRSTEVGADFGDLPRIAGRAIDYLLVQQRPDGSWGAMGPEQESYRLGITALAGRALLAWSGETTPDRRDRVDLAIARARNWLRSARTAQEAESANSFGAAYAVSFWTEMMLRDAAARDDAQEAVRFLLRGQAANGAWSYSARFGAEWTGGVGGWPRSSEGRYHSVNTALSLSVLAEARSRGLRVDPAALARGGEALRRMKTGPAAFTYTWPGPRTFERPETSLGRAVLCEFALTRLDLSPREDVDRAIGLFLAGCEWLRVPAKVSPDWTGPGALPSYFCFFAWYHGAEAIAYAGGPLARERSRRLVTEVLKAVESDGTWVDEPIVGKCYGTAMALLTLRKLR
jgi:hypothetical protein